MITNARPRSAAGICALLMAAHAAAAQRPLRPMSLEDVLAIRNVGAPAMSPDGRLVAFPLSAWEHTHAGKGEAADTNQGGTPEMRTHLWLVPADGSAPPRQITFSQRGRGESQPAWSPDGTVLAFLSARGAPAAGASAPEAQIQLLPMSGGEARPLTHARAGVSSYAWSPDGRSIAFQTTDSLSRALEARRKRHDDAMVYEGDQRLSHLWVVDVATGRERELVHDARFTLRGAPDWSPDGTRLAIVTSPTPLARDERRTAYIVDAATGAVTALHVAGDVQQTPRWSPDGRTLALLVLARTHVPLGDSTMDRALRNDHLVLYDVATGSGRDVSSEQFDASPGTPVWSPDGQHIYFTAADRVWSSVYRYDLADGAYRRLTNRQLIRAPSFSRDGKRAAMLVESATAPNDVAVSDADFTSTRRVSTANPQLAGMALGRSEVISWKSSDGQAVQGVLLLPVDYQRGRRYPLLVQPHGGPTGAHTDGFKATWSAPGQFWAGQGWAVLYPNPRGSTGYGERFMRGNIPDWGGGDYRDIMSGVDAVIARGVADSSRMAVAGWSYGGYMTDWIVTQTGRFKAARTGAGLSDLESMYGTTDIPDYLGSFFHGGPGAKTLALYRARSPITYIDRVTTPLLILQGAADERVPIGQSLEMYRGLEDQGKPVRLVFYPREHHGFTEYYHQLDKMRREYEWIARYTLGSKAVSLR